MQQESLKEVRETYLSNRKVKKLRMEINWKTDYFSEIIKCQIYTSLSKPLISLLIFD